MSVYVGKRWKKHISFKGWVLHSKHPQLFGRIDNIHFIISIRKLPSGKHHLSSIEALRDKITMLPTMGRHITEGQADPVGRYWVGTFTARWWILFCSHCWPRIWALHGHTFLKVWAWVQLTCSSYVSAILLLSDLDMVKQWSCCCTHLQQCFPHFNWFAEWKWWVRWWLHPKFFRFLSCLSSNVLLTQFWSCLCSLRSTDLPTLSGLGILLALAVASRAWTAHCRRPRNVGIHLVCKFISPAL